MKQSQYDPTLKEHFSEEEARRWIRHLEKLVDAYEEKYKNQKKFSKEKGIELRGKLDYYRKKYLRIITHLEFLQEKYPDIDFGVEAFKRKHDLEK